MSNEETEGALTLDELKDLIKEDHKLVNALIHKHGEVLTNQKSAIKEQIIAQVIAAVFVLTGFALITWRTVSVLEVKLDYIEKKMEAAEIANDKQLLLVDKQIQVLDAKIEQVKGRQ